MSTPTSLLSPSKIDFFSAARENTGSHFLDSGSAYGRWYDAPAVTPEQPALLWPSPDDIQISTPHLLDTWFDINHVLQRQWYSWDLKHGHETSWFESASHFLTRSRGLVKLATNNVYNGENQLSQMYVWQVWEPEDTGRDWIYPKDNTIVVVFMHTGCDVRGGYGRPLFCASKQDYTIPVDLCAGFRCDEARRPLRHKYSIPGTTPLFDASGIAVPQHPRPPGCPQELSWDACQALDNSWQQGYSNWPLGELRKSVRRWFPWGWQSSDPVRLAQLHTGEIVKIRAYCDPLQ